MRRGRKHFECSAFSIRKCVVCVCVCYSGQDGYHTHQINAQCLSSIKGTHYSYAILYAGMLLIEINSILRKCFFISQMGFVLCALCAYGI